MNERKVLSIDELREQSKPLVAIPNFDNTGFIYTRLRKPRLLNMAKEGKIPNHLLGIATTMITGYKDDGKKKSKGIDLLKDAALMTELYCGACMVEPTYEEMKDIITDNQSDFIFKWALGEVESLDSFRTDKADDRHNNDVKEVPDKAK